MADLVRRRDRRDGQCRPARGAEQGQFHPRPFRGQSYRRGRVQGPDGAWLYRALAAQPGAAARAAHHDRHRGRDSRRRDGLARIGRAGRLMLPFARVSIIGLGLIGSSIARAVRMTMPTVALTGHDSSPEVRARATELGFCDDVTDTAGAAVIDADLVILCVPVGAIGDVAAQLADDMPGDAIISDVGSSKAGVLAALAQHFPDRRIVPAHPVAGTEYSGPDAGFATLFKGRWCILTPPGDADPAAVMRVSTFWERLGA